MKLDISIPDSLRPILAELPQAYFIGGSVRDALLGIEPKDIDIEVHELPEIDLLPILARHGRIDQVGKAFGVTKLTAEDGNTYDFSLPRRDNKTGQGHKDFVTIVEPFMGPRAATQRRDFTINSIMVHTTSGEVLDFFNGIEDLQAGILRAIDAKTFVEDPLRVLRAFQFAARMGLQTEEPTTRLCQSLIPKFDTLPKERVWEEWNKWATKSQVPSAGIRNLIQTGWIQHFPEIDGLENIPQDPEWHPEGNVFNHNLHCMDALAENPEWRGLDETARVIPMLAILCHDLGKKTHTASSLKTRKITAIGHEAAGVEPTLRFLDRIGCPQKLRKPIVAMIEAHMNYTMLHENSRPESRHSQERAMREAKRMGDQGTTLAELFFVIAADHAGRPPLPPELPKRAQTLREAAKLIGVWRTAPVCPVKGQDLMKLGIKPGPHMGKLLKLLEDRFLSLEFKSREEGIAFFEKNITELHQSAGVAPQPLLEFQEVKGLCKNIAETKIAYRTTFRAQLLGKITTKEEAIKHIQDNPVKETPHAFVHEPNP